MTDVDWAPAVTPASKNAAQQTLHFISHLILTAALSWRGSVARQEWISSI
jgi:hypothetical protein